MRNIKEYCIFIFIIYLFTKYEMLQAVIEGQTFVDFSIEKIMRANAGNVTVELRKGTMNPGMGTMNPVHGTMNPGKGSMNPGEEIMNSGGETIDPGKGTMIPGKLTMNPTTGTMDLNKGKMNLSKRIMNVTTAKMNSAKENMNPRKKIIVKATKKKSKRKRNMHLTKVSMPFNETMQTTEVISNIKNKVKRDLIIPVLVIACNRITVLRCLRNLARYRPDNDTFPIIVSQDCDHNSTYIMIKHFVNTHPSTLFVRHPVIKTDVLYDMHFGYIKISKHYKKALNYVFKTLGYDAAIVVEDDLDIAPDFFEYFYGTYPLLLRDSTLWCISAWNDNGKKHLIDLSRPELLHRTDFFPGLGWMLRRHSWDYFEPLWPIRYFDDWLRTPNNTKGKACIRPEISRTHTFGKKGVSHGQYYLEHIQNNHLNTKFVPFTKMNLSYLIKETYDRELTKAIKKAKPMSASSVVKSVSSNPGGAALITYYGEDGFKKAAWTLTLMSDLRGGLPRTSYQGIVNCHINGRRVYLVPGKEHYLFYSYSPTIKRRQEMRAPQSSSEQHSS